MRAFVACLTVLALVGHAKTDRFRSVLVGGDTDWQTSGRSQGCDICSQKHEGQTYQGGGYRNSYSSRYPSSREVAPRYSSSWGSEELSGSGLLGRSGGGRRTYHYSSEESEYTFSNGTHSTTITSKRSSEGVPEFHLKMTRLRDGAIIESTVLSESEYRRRRASLGLTGSDGSFGFESLGGRDVHALSGRGLSEEDLLTDLKRRLDRRRGGHGRHSTTRFSSEESHYSFSNGTHTTSITGRRNSDGVREYGLELIRNSDDAVLDRATISEAEYNRRRQSMTSGEGFDNVFDIHGIRGSGSRSSEYDSRFDSRSRSRSDGRSDRRTDSRYASHHDSRIDSRSRFRSEIDSASKDSEFDSRSSGGRSVPAGSPGSSGSRTSTYFREERTESLQHSGDEACSCVERSRCRMADRVYSTEAMLRCEGDEVCCRRSQPRRPAPARPTQEPRYSQPARPQAEPQVSEPSCSCVSRDACSYRDREYSVAALEKCRRPMVCCRRRAPSSGSGRSPTPPRATRPAPRRTTPSPALVEQERELFRDIVQHVDTEDAPSQRQLNTNDLQASISRYDDAHAVPSSHRRTEVTRTEHSRTETSGGRYRPRQPATSGQRTSSTSSRHQGFSSRDTSGSSDDDRSRPDSDDALVRSSSTYSYRRASSGSTDADGGRGRPYDTSRSQYRQDAGGHEDSSGGSRVISSSRRYSEHRTVTGEDSDEDERPILDSSRRESLRREEQHLAQRPLDLHDRGVDSSSSSHRYSYRRSSSSSSSTGDVGEASRLLGADGAGRRSFEGSLHGQHTDQHAEPVVTSSSHFRSVQRTVSDGSGGDLPVSGSGGLERSHGERHLVSGIAGGDDLGLGTVHGAGGHSSGSRYSSSSSWSSRSESGSAEGLVPGVTHTYQAGPSGRSGSSYRYSSSTRSSQTIPAPATSSSSWNRYSQHSERHKRSLSSLFRSYDEEPSVYDRDRDDCVCVRFDRCSDGNLLHHGADLLDFSIGSRKQCSGFRVCCDMPPEVLSRLEATPGLRPGVVTSVPTADLDLPTSRMAPLAPHVSGDQPCVCVSSYLCQDGRIAASQQMLVDMRQVSQTGRCSYQDQVCCAVPWGQVQPTPTPPPPPCTCVSGSHCRQQDIMTRYANPNAPTCPGTQVCCTRPPRGHGDGDYGGPSPDTHLSNDEFNMYLFCKSYPLSVACFKTHQFGYQPTIWPTRGFNADSDAYALQRALRGDNTAFRIFRRFTTDDKVLIDILTRRTFRERALIKTSYKTLTGEELRDDVRKGTSGNYENFMLDLLDGSSMEEYLAKRLHEGMDGIGTDEDVVLETLISSTNEEIAAIKPFFYNESGHTLEDDIADDFSGDLEDILVGLAAGSRDGSLTVDQHEAGQAATALRRAGEDRLGTEEETFKYYLTHENYAQLVLIFSKYERLTGKSFSDALKDEFSKHTEDAVLAIVEVTKNLPSYFAGRLHDALWSKGIFGKDDSALRRILISRSERDLGSIAQEYHTRYGTPLREDIEAKATGDYEDALLSLLGHTS